MNDEPKIFIRTSRTVGKSTMLLAAFEKLYGKERIVEVADENRGGDAFPVLTMETLKKGFEELSKPRRPVPSEHEFHMETVHAGVWDNVPVRLQASDLHPIPHGNRAQRRLAAKKARR